MLLLLRLLMAMAAMTMAATGTTEAGGPGCIGSVGRAEVATQGRTWAQGLNHCLHRRLRGGSIEHLDTTKGDAGKEDEILDQVRELIDKLDAQFQEQEEEMFPMQGEPKLRSNVIYNDVDNVDPDEDSSGILKDDEPNPELLDQSMQFVDRAEELIKALSPENIIKKVEEAGGRIEDIEPVIGPDGRCLGNFTSLQHSRAKVMKDIKEIRKKHKLLRSEMERKSPGQQLLEEIANVRFLL